MATVGVQLLRFITHVASRRINNIVARCYEKRNPFILAALTFGGQYKRTIVYTNGTAAVHIPVALFMILVYVVSSCREINCFRTPWCSFVLCLFTFHVHGVHYVGACLHKWRCKFRREDGGQSRGEEGTGQSERRESGRGDEGGAGWERLTEGAEGGASREGGVLTRSSK